MFTSYKTNRKTQAAVIHLSVISRVSFRLAHAAASKHKATGTGHLVGQQAVIIASAKSDRLSSWRGNKLFSEPFVGDYTQWQQ